MDLLIDTHVFLWWEASSPKMPPHVHAALADPANAIFVSAASVWEVAIKKRMGQFGKVEVLQEAFIAALKMDS